MPKRTRQELLQALAIQRNHLAISCRAYDAGTHSEALRLATAAYTILHDGGKMRSILSQLGIKDQIQFLATNVDVAGLSTIATRCTPLIELDHAVDGVRFVPICSYVKKRDWYLGGRHLGFKKWWEEDPIFVNDALRLNRKKLIFALRNAEGGSHFDDEVRDPNYAALKQPVHMFFPGPPLSKFPKLDFKTMYHLELACMRQVAEEIRITLGLYDAEQNNRTDADGNLLVEI